MTNQILQTREAKKILDSIQRLIVNSTGDDMSSIQVNRKSRIEEGTFDFDGCCAFLGISASSLRAYVRCGHIRYTKLGHRYRFRREWIDAFLESQATGGTGNCIGNDTDATQTESDADRILAELAR